MKKAIYLVAVATLAFFSCQKQELDPSAKDEARKGLTFKASIEQLTPDTKAAINDNNSLVWAKKDMIGIYFPDWGDKNQPFKLNDADDGNVDGTFTIASTANPSGATATVAYFPWWDTESFSTNYPSSSQTNVWNGVVYFKLKNEYYGYSDGRMLTPLVAPISSSSDVINFKHAGAAVKLTINNLVSGTYKAKMSVAGQQITGDFHVNPANAGNEALTLDAAADITKNNVTLVAWKSTGAFNWIFPVPELATPKLSFNIKDNNGVTVWNANLKAQSSNLNRGDILILPAQTITPYAKLTQSTEWAFCGTINGINAWDADIPLYTDGEVCVLSGVTFVAGDEFKIRKNKAWTVAYPSSNWKFTDENAGAKDIIFNISTHEIKAVDHTFPYPAADLSSLATSSIKIDGDMSDWTTLPSISSTGTSRIRSWKFSSDNDNLYFYLVLRKNKMRTAYNLTLGFSWDDSGSYSGDNLNSLESVVVFQPFTNADAGTPVCVNGTISTATINGTEESGLSIKAFGYDPNTAATGETADYYLEVSIPKSAIPNLPASGSIQAGFGYEWYNTSLQDITL